MVVYPSRYWCFYLSGCILWYLLAGAVPNSGTNFYNCSLCVGLIGYSFMGSRLLLADESDMDVDYCTLNLYTRTNPLIKVHQFNWCSFSVLTFYSIILISGNRLCNPPSRGKISRYVLCTSYIIRMLHGRILGFDYFSCLYTIFLLYLMGN